LTVAVAGVLSFGGFGLLLAVSGVYHFGLVLVVGALLTAGLSAVAWPDRVAAGRVPAGVTAPALVLCAGMVAFVGWNASYAGHHVTIGRDPGVYADTGKWISVHGNLEVPTGAQWASKGPGLTEVSFGTYVVGNHVDFQFDHLTPVLLAEANNLGGDGLMFRVPAVLSALALCAVYTVGCRLVRRPWLVLAAIVALAFSLPVLNLARDAFSEPAVELLLWAGMWLLLVAYEGRALGPALLAGAALAGTVMSRIDAPVYLIPLPILGALAWLSAHSATDRRRLARMVGVFLVGAIPVAVLGTVDVVSLSGTYYHDLRGSVRPMVAGLFASLLVAVVLIIGGPYARSRFAGARRWFGANRNSIATVAGLIVAMAFLALWAARPAITHPRGTSTSFIANLQRNAGLPVDPGQAYTNDTVIWLSWYLGPVAIALAGIGAAIAVVRIIRRPTATYLLVLSMAGIGTALYLWNPSIVPDQIWAMRRFVPAAMPLLVLLAALAISAIASMVANQAGSLAGAAAVGAGAVGMIVFPIATTVPVRDFQPEANFSAGITATCRAIGPKAAVVVAPGDELGEEYVSALRSWCNVPVAMLARPFTAAEMKNLADKWHAEGVTLWIIGSTPAFVTSAAPGLTPSPLASVASPRDLEITINRPPSHYAPTPLDIYGSRVSP
jgi:hypothetical protein